MKLSLRNLYLSEETEKKKDSKTAESENKEKENLYEPVLSLHSLYQRERSLDEQIFERSELNSSPENVKITPSDEAIMNSLEVGIEKAIENSIELEEEKNYDGSKTLKERMSARGFEYENTVIDALMQAKASGNITAGAGASAAASDADMNIFGKIFNVEIKLNPNAQMGGSSIRYNKNGEVNLVSNLEEDTEALLIEAVLQKKKNINRLLNFLTKQNPKNINGKAIKFPMTCTKRAWDRAQRADLLVNTKVPLDAEFIANHYAKKGIYYIQIGKAGLFYLKSNPAKLPIPKLQGNVVIEIRSARSGSKRLASGVEVVGSGIRVQGRLKTKNKSPYTIDDPSSIQSMLQAVRGDEPKASKEKEAEEEIN